MTATIGTAAQKREAKTAGASSLANTRRRATVCARAVVRINKLTGRVLKEFKSIHAAAFAYGESDKMVRDQCKLNKLPFGW